MIIFIPGWLISLITFPGVIVHEIAHRLCCDILHVPVYEVAYFRPFRTIAGHVLHGNQTDFYPALLIATAPFFVNSLVCMLLTLPFGLSNAFDTELLLTFGTPSMHSRFRGLLYLTGISVGCNAIPSSQDLDGLTKKAQSRTQRAIALLVRILCFPFNQFGGFIFSMAYTYLLSKVLPHLFMILLNA